MIENSPLVSVIMTAYNREHFISEAIESVMNNSYQNFELIIVDDGSKDQTVNIAKDYAQSDVRVKVFVNEKNLGDYPNRNKAASYAKGKYIMFCDSDDSLIENGIERCVESMLKFPNAKFGLYWAYNERDPFTRTPSESVKKNFFGEPFLGMGPGSTIIESDFFNKIDGYPVKYGPANDMYFNLKVICYTDILLLPFKFSNYRIHENQERNNIEKYLIYNYLYFKDALNELPLQLTTKEKNWLSKKNKRRFFVNILKYYFRSFNFLKTKQIYLSSGFSFHDILLAIFQF